MKNNKGIVKILIVIILVFVVVGIYYNPINQKISRDLGIHVPNSLKFEYEDTHHWFLGDGITLAQANLNENQIKQIIDKSDTNWIKTPMAPEIRKIIYNEGLDNKDTESIEPSRGIDEIGKGYWIFKDRTSKESKERFPDTVTGNYSLGIINLDFNVFYYIKFDS